LRQLPSTLATTSSATATAPSPFRVIQADKPGFPNTFRRPTRKSAQALLTAVRLLARDVEAVAPTFLARAMPDTFLAELTQLLDAYEHAVNAREMSKGETAAARASIRSALSAGLAAVRRLDVIIANHARHDSVKTGRYEPMRGRSVVTNQCERSRPLRPISGGTPVANRCLAFSFGARSQGRCYDSAVRMLFRHDILQGIAEGRVTLAFRRWRRAPPADGSSLRSPVGVLRLDRVAVVDEGDITPDDVRRTGLSVDELRASIAGEGTLLRIELRLAGDDPRIALRQRLPDRAELDALVARLAQIDAASATPWTTRYLQLIAEQSGIVSRVLAQQVDADVLPFKRRVRQLKELGLTDSLEVGYRLSPRGHAVLECLKGR
jgi:hypothetical protein